jgi:hypothetical protein
MALLNQITDEARRLGSIADMNISDMSANAPVGTTLAILERQLKTMSAVQARVHYSMKEEFKLLKRIIRDNTPGEYEYVPQGGNPKAKRADYDMVDVIPVSDPNSATMAQRIMQYQAAVQLAQGAPHIYDLPQLHRQMLQVLGIKNADKLVPIEDDMTPRDPVSENMALLTGKPTKAFLYQDHDAHIAVHTAMMQDPKIMAQMGQNPQAQQMQASIMAHIAEHVAFQYRSQLQERLGATLPEPNAEIPKELEVQLSRVVAQAAGQLLTMHQGEAAQAQAQQQMQDPIVQMQMQELAIKKQEADTKARKVEGELALEEQRLQVDAMKAGVMGRAEDQTILMEDRERAARLELELRQEQERHAQQVAAVQQQQMMAAQQHQQKLAHGGQVHGQKLAQSHQMHTQKLRASQQPTPAAKPPGSKGE